MKACDLRDKVFAAAGRGDNPDWAEKNRHTEAAIQELERRAMLYDRLTVQALPLRQLVLLRSFIRGIITKSRAEYENVAEWLAWQKVSEIFQHEIDRKKEEAGAMEATHDWVRKECGKDVADVWHWNPSAKNQPKFAFAPKQPARILSEAADFLTKNEWIQDRCAADKDGISCDPCDEDAHKFCAMGALFRIGYGKGATSCAPTGTPGRASVAAAQSALIRAIGGGSVSVWNDGVGMTKRKVIAMLRKAAKMLDAAEARFAFPPRTAGEVLRGAAELLESGEWTRGTLARRADNEICEPHDRKAKKFCLMGAIIRAEQGRKPGEGAFFQTAHKALIAAINAAVAKWNDGEGRTKGDCIRALRKAADGCDRGIYKSKPSFAFPQPPEGVEGAGAVATVGLLLIEQFGWTQGALARTPQGRECGPLSDKAACFCANGAIDRAAQICGADAETRDHAYDAVKWGADLKGSPIMLQDWNDAADTKIIEVIRAFRKAAMSFYVPPEKLPPLPYSDKVKPAAAHFDGRGQAD